MMRAAAAVLLAAATLAGCSRESETNDAAATGGVVSKSEADAEAAAGLAAGAIPQRLTLTIDGKAVPADPDRPHDGHVSMATIAQNTLTIYVLNGETDTQIGISAKYTGSQPAPGQLLSYACRGDLGCDEPEAGTLTGTLLTAAPKADGTAPASNWTSYKAQKLGLEPLTITLTANEPVDWPGVGPSRRIKGTFSGMLAHVVPEGGNPRIEGPLRKVEGSFDMYAISR